MFESVALESPDDWGGHASDDLDDVPEWLLDGVPDFPPDEWAEGESAPAHGSWEPSGWLALDLETTAADPAELSDHALIEAMIGFDRLASWAAARQARLFDELARRRPTDKAPHSARRACLGSEYAPDEVGVALHLARGTACARIGLARRLLATLPDTHALWESGLIDTFKARAIDDATAVLTDELARKVEAAVLPRAPEQTLAELKAALARAVIAADPKGAEKRHKEARRDRRVVVTPEPDGMGTLWAMLTATEAAGAFTWLTRLARGLGADDPRPMDARRADILSALLNGRLVLNPDADTDAAGATPPTGDPEKCGSETCAPETCAPEKRAPENGDGGPDDQTCPSSGRLIAGGGHFSDGESGDGNCCNDQGSGGAAGNGNGNASTASTDGAATATTPASLGRPIQPVTPGKPLIQVVIPYSTLIGADDHPAELVGHGPHPRLTRPRDRRRRGLAAPGHRPALRHRARLRPHHLPPTRRPRRSRQSPRRPL